MKKYLISFLSFVAVALGTALFVIWKLYKHKENLFDAKEFLKLESSLMKEGIIKGLNLKETEFEKQALEIRTLHEKQTKKEVIDAFKEAFGVIPANK